MLNEKGMKIVYYKTVSAANQEVNLRLTKFFQEIDWVQGENNAYRKWPLEFQYALDAKKGHLPLTNCLRGTQLFQAVLEHPAFQEKKKKVNTAIEKDSIKI